VALSPALTSLPNSAFVEAERRATRYQRYWKRALDLAFGIPLFVAAVPVIGILGIGVGLTSGWPVLYSARRIGLNGKPFRMWKLRSMVKDADRLLDEWRISNPELAEQYFADFKLENDPRVTAFGRFLRKSSLDELPQLWNVLRGEMSLVGPRPIVQDELSHYGAGAATFLSVRPGVTGYWQTEGRNGVKYPERSWYELSYCRKHNLSLDLKILLKTLRCPIRFDG
jgi:lipopolysaccharide/colanic/teichoic acid biosynthesis glycosyltransferase